MIYTITLNPSIDCYLEMDQFAIGKINSVNYTSYFAGGKGVNVSKVLSYLGINSISLGFLGGPMGKMFRNLLDSYGFVHKFTEIKDITRQNIKIRSHEETDLNSIGPTISSLELQEFIKQLDDIKVGDYVVISGRPPRFETDDALDLIFDKLSQTKAKLIVDMSGEHLKKSLKYHPYLIKPNKEEFSELISKTDLSKQELIEELKFFVNTSKVEKVLLSLGEDGAILMTKSIFLETKSKAYQVVDTVGAGDTMIAGFLAGELLGLSVEDCLSLATQCAAITVRDKHLPSKEKFEEVLGWIASIQNKH